MQICPLLFVRMPPQWAVEEEWAGKRGEKIGICGSTGRRQDSVRWQTYTTAKPMGVCHDKQIWSQWYWCR